MAKSIIVLACLCGLHAAVAAASTYYVSPSGNDRNTGGSWDSAWRTLQHAAVQAVPGDTVVIRKGNVPYGHLPVIRSGKAGKPITFRGELPGDPPILSGAVQVRRWTESQEEGVWRVTGQARTVMFVEDGKPLPPASSARCTDGRWHWSDNRMLHYRPSSGDPKKHEVWIAPRGGGVVIGGHSWIVVENLYAWFGGGAGVSIKGGQHNVVRNMRAKWHWRGADITQGANHNLIENFLAEENSEGIYISRASSYNTVQNCRVYRNGNPPIWNKGDRAGVDIGGTGPNTGNTVEGCDIAYNGGPDSDPALMAFKAPQTLLRRNRVHDNFSSGIYVTIGSNDSRVIGNIVERNGIPGVKGGYKGIAGLSVRRSRNVLVEGNRVVDNWVSPDSPWPSKGGPKGGLDLQGLPSDDMSNIIFRGNTVSGTRGGPDVFVSSDPDTHGLEIEPAQAPEWLKERKRKPPQPQAVEK